MDPIVTPTGSSSVDRHEREKENPQIVDVEKGNISPDAQLQIAALIGYLDIAKQVLIQRPQLARDLNNMLVATNPREPAPSTAQEQEILSMEQLQVVVDGANDESSNINDPTKLNKACCCMPSKKKVKLVVDGDQEKWIREKKNTLMVVASLIATLTFQAALNPPGGVWQGQEQFNPSLQLNPSLTQYLSIPRTEIGPSPVDSVSIPGTTINEISISSPFTSFSLFMIFDTVGLAASLSIILLLTGAVPIRCHCLMWVLVVVMWVAVTSVALAFIFGLHTLLRDIREVPVLFMGCSVFLFSVIFLLNIVRFVVYLVKKGISALKKLVACCCVHLC